jgi:hypothetical protein
LGSITTFTFGPTPEAIGIVKNFAPDTKPKVQGAAAD